MKNIQQHIKLIVILILLPIAYCLLPGTVAYATLPSSTHYQIQNYSFGAGGTPNSNSTNYKVNGIAGEVEFGQISSTNFKANSGLTFLETANVPSAPTVSNESNQDYNKLKITLSTGSNPTDYQYAIAISPDGFATTTKYIQADGTLNTSPVWQVSGGAGWSTTALYAIGLSQNTTYSVKVKTRQGNFTQSGFGPVATATTAISSFTFSLNNNTVTIGSLAPNTVITAGTTVTATVSTNGTGGAIVSLYGTNNGLKSTGTNYTISSSTSDLTAATEGYGIQGTTITQTSGGPMEILSPYNVASNNVGAVTTTKQPIFDSTGSPVTSGQGTFKIMAKAGTTTKAASDYKDTVTIIASGTF